MRLIATTIGGAAIGLGFAMAGYSPLTWQYWLFAAPLSMALGWRMASHKPPARDRKEGKTM